MSNLCLNFIELKKTFSNREELEQDIMFKFLNALENLTENDEICFFRYLYPDPKDIHASDLVDWHYEHWGVKKDCSFTYDSIQSHNLELNISENEIEFSIDFDTDWVGPIKFYEYLTEKGYEIYAEFHDEAVGLIGKYSSKDGYEEDEYTIPTEAEDYTDEEKFELEKIYEQLDKKYKMFDANYLRLEKGSNRCITH